MADVAKDRSYDAKPNRPEFAKDCAGDDAGTYQHNAYNWDMGTVGATFAWRSECRGEIVTIDSKFGHSWEKTNLTGIGVYVWGISFNWESGDQRFEAIPNPPGEWKC